MVLTKQRIQQQAANHAIDLVGFCRWSDLEATAPAYDKPSYISETLQTLIVLAQRIPTGVSSCVDETMIQYANGRIARHLEEASGELAFWLEKHGTLAGIVGTTMPNTRRQPLGYSSPAGQGSLLLRQAAVLAGLGSLGLNTMLLTPRFGPRVFLSGVLTDLAVEPDRPFTQELCLGPEDCGRCADVCPVQAIPKDEPGIDAERCAERTQPYGPRAMVAQLKRIFKAGSLENRREIINEPHTRRVWHNMTVQRQGGFTSCMRCEQVCPVGEDYTALEDFADQLRELDAEAIDAFLILRAHEDWPGNYEQR